MEIEDIMFTIMAILILLVVLTGGIDQDNL